MSEINWIRLRVDMFDDEKIKMIQSLPDGDSLLVVWIRLIMLAGKCNAKGLVLVDEEFPYNDEMLSVIFGKPLNTVRLAIATFERYKMIERTEKGIYITNFEKHQNAEGLDKIREQNRIRKQRERERKRALLLEESGDVPALPCGDLSVTCHDMSRDNMREVTQQRENKKENKDIYNISSNEDIVGEESADAPGGQEPEKAETEKNTLAYGRIMEDYHKTCVDLPGIKAMSEKRRRSIRTLLNELKKLKVLKELTPYEQLHTIFQMAQDSDFLSGRSGRWDGCSFDWLINKSNALKVLEGNYVNKGGGGGGGNHARNNEPNVSRPDESTNEALARFRRNNGKPEI